ncbi:MAG: tRNA pseudouridine synthase B [candidate division TM6 bacterium GW2011_GWF2_28_16]|nr:MAG: tRNA pseudouridine synthase B [candidate division TM6 bacterium GW2011_GWF2_28_16]
MTDTNNINDKLNGFLLINKPESLSSYDCIRVIKKIIKNKLKIGHTGTLDNFATGLLIIAIGKATKQIDLFLNTDKEYIATGKLHELTDTLDNTGNIILNNNNNNNNITLDTLTDTIKNFTGKYLQTPPIYSALKYNGEPLYKLAREKKLTEQELNTIIKDKTRECEIYNIKLIDYNYPFFTIKAHVSKGTYIRSLVDDIAQKLNTHATCYKLTRTKIGNINIKDAINLDNLKNIQDIESKLINSNILLTKI